MLFVVSVYMCISVSCVSVYHASLPHIDVLQSTALIAVIQNSYNNLLP